MVDKDVVMAYMNIKSMPFQSTDRPLNAVNISPGVYARGEPARLTTTRSDIESLKWKRQKSVSNSSLSMLPTQFGVRNDPEEAEQTCNPQSNQMELPHRSESDNDCKRNREPSESAKHRDGGRPVFVLGPDTYSECKETHNRRNRAIRSSAHTSKHSQLGNMIDGDDWKDYSFEEKSQLVENRCTHGVPHGQLIPIIVVLSTFAGVVVHVL